MDADWHPERASAREAARQDVLPFFYDAQSRPAKVSYSGVIYTCVYGLQGDIVGLLDTLSTLVVEYRYDARGKAITTTGSLAATLGKHNPFCYRGYIYDEETGLYYLRSRCYNPTVGRFVNTNNTLPIRGVRIRRYVQMKTRKTSSSKMAVVKNRKYYIMQVVEYLYIGTIAFFSSQIISLFSRFLTGVFDGEAVGAIQTISKIMYIIVHLLGFAIVEWIFRRKILDYKTVEE